MGRVAEDFAAALEGGKVPTPISGRRRAAGRPGGAKPKVETRPAKARGCSWCGGRTEGRRKTCSEECAGQVLAQTHEQFARTSSERQRGMDRRKHPALTEEANRKRMATRKAQREAELAWDREHPKRTEVDRFATSILPRRQGVTASDIARRTGLSIAYCSRVKRGQPTPHPRWWEILERCG